VLQLLRASGEGEAFAYLDSLPATASSEGGAPAPIPEFRKVADQLYWKRQALTEFVILYQEHVRRLETALKAAPNEEARGKWNLALGGCCYNLASFTWPGWNDPGIVVRPMELGVGRQAAARCLEIRKNELKRADSFGYTLAMAHWVVGAHHMAIGDFEPARQQFVLERQCDQETGSDDSLARGYLALASLLERPYGRAAQSGFQEIVDALEAGDDEDAGFYREQLLTARRVFQKRDG
jgi:hypothetical protein